MRIESPRPTATASIVAAFDPACPAPVHLLTDGMRALRRACLRGDIQRAKELHAEHLFATADIRSNKNKLLRDSVACRGNTDIVLWLSGEFDLTIGDIRSRKNEALRTVCEQGDLAMLQLLYDTFGIMEKDMRVGQGAPLRHACAGGYLELAQWIVSNFEGAAADLRFRNCEPLRTARANGHHNVEEWGLAHLAAM